ncbi:hypothetical protein [Niabella beijingensis]|uniref:hypothetical protein n=1 Tax=Niabella beijingensis TaxID=2872700 RepID=UPI001CC12A2A|nr:hypothetical protein [Niabella beijingensis]MBZ4188696.1 hypothetical protein [Niabella beijingensis]
MSKHLSDKEVSIPCCPQLSADDHCDVIRFSRVLTYPTATLVAGRRNVLVEVILRFKFSRCTEGLVLGDPVYSTTLLPGEKVRLTTTDRRNTFSYDSETKLSYRSEQISEEQYYMSAVQKYMADASAAQSGEAESASEGKWDFHGDASGSVNPFSLSASASTNARGSHNSHSVADYLNQQRSHMESAASQAVEASRKAHSVSIGEVSSRTHIEGESEDHFEASSREFMNRNQCHAVTYMFYRLNKKQRIKFELEAIERRVLDENAPIAGVLKPGTAKLPVALVPQDIPATAVLNRVAAVNIAARANVLSLAADFNSLSDGPKATVVPLPAIRVDQGNPIDAAARQQALKEVDEQLAAKGLIDKSGNAGNEIKKVIAFETEFSLPTPGIIVKGCLDECDVCEPLLKERLQLENDLLRKQIELLEKSQEYRCCPVEKTDAEN